MKVISSNGKELTVWDVGAKLMHLTAHADGPPIKFNGTFIMDDETAREKIRVIVSGGFYHRTNLQPEPKDAKTTPCPFRDQAPQTNTDNRQIPASNFPA